MPINPSHFRNAASPNNDRDKERLLDAYCRHGHSMVDLISVITNEVS